MHKIIVWFMVVTVLSCRVALSDPPDETVIKSLTVEDELGPLTPEAEKIVAELRATLSKDSEALAMLENILVGSTLGPDDGWFPLAKSQTRFGWEYVCETYDSNLDSMISASEFDADKNDFERLDRDSNGTIEKSDFDWSRHSLAYSPGMSLFFMADVDGNGKLTPDEFHQLFQNLSGSPHEYISLDDVRDQFQPPSRSPSTQKRADHPSRSTLIAGLKSQEIGSLQSGPTLDEFAPDFTLESMDGTQVRLSNLIGPKPIVLIFGNFTCGPFRSHSGNIEKLFHRYKERVNFLLIYVREAHPTNGWWMQSNQRVGIVVEQPLDFESRRSVARVCRDRLKIEIPMLVDTIDDQVGAQYSGMPNRLYLIDRQGKIAFKNGRGPFGFHPRQLEQAMVLMLNHRP